MERENDDMFSENFQRRAKWSLDVGQEDCSEVFAKVIELEELRQLAMKKIPETQSIALAHHALHQLRRLQPAATSGSVEEEKDMEVIDEALQDMMSVEIVHELAGPEANQGPDFLTKLLAAASALVKFKADVDGLPTIAHSVSACKKDTCFVQSAPLTMWAFLVTQTIFPVANNNPTYKVSAIAAPTIGDFLEKLGDTRVGLVATAPKDIFTLNGGVTVWNVSNESDDFIFSQPAGNPPPTASDPDPFMRFAAADIKTRSSSLLLTPERIQTYADIWNTVCAPEFIQLLLKPIERIGRAFPDTNKNTLEWKKMLEQRTADQPPFNYMCNEVVGVSDDWCVNVLMTSSKIFLPRVVPDLGAGNFTRFVALCRYDGGPTQCFGMLVFDWGSGTLSYVDDPASKVRDRHLNALQDWFALGHKAIMRAGKQKLPKIQRIYFSSMDSSWERLCRTLGTNGADLLTCIALATNAEDKCAAGEMRERTAGDLAYSAVATVASGIKRGIKSALFSSVDFMLGRP